MAARLVSRFSTRNTMATLADDFAGASAFLRWMAKDIVPAAVSILAKYIPCISLVSMPSRAYQSARTFASWHGSIEIAPTYRIFAAGGVSAKADAERKTNGITRQIFR